MRVGRKITLRPAGGAPSSPAVPLRLPHRLTCLLLLLGGGLASPHPIAAAGDVANVWQHLSIFLTPEAAVALRDLPATADPAQLRERDFAGAVILLDQQPLTEARLDEAEARFRMLAGGDDDIAAAALFLLARSRQLYRAQPDPVGAATLYTELTNAPHGGLWAGQARVKLALLHLYVLPTEGGPPARLANAGSLLAETLPAVVQRDLNRVLARATLFYDLNPAHALAHLEAAEILGGLRGAPHADQLVQLAELCWELGRREDAARYHARLKAEHPRDMRIWFFEQHLAGRPVPARASFGHGD